MTDQPVKPRRRTYIVRMDFQYDFIIKFCILTVIASVIVAGIIYFVCGTTVTTVFRDSRLKILSTSDFIMPYLLLSSFIAIFFSTLACWWMTLLISNRLAGPIFRLEKDIAKMAEGDLTVHFRVRKDDELKSLASIINAMARDLQGDVRTLKEQVDRNELDKAKALLAKYKV